MMKSLLLFLSLTTVTQGYFQPNGACKCFGAGNGTIRTFDGFYKSIFGQQETLVSQWGFRGDTDSARRENPCRFRLRVVTGYDPSDQTTVYIDWAGFGFDVTNLKNNPNRNLVFGHYNNIIIERGKGIQGDRTFNLDQSNYLYYRTGFLLYVFKDFAIKLRTDTCQYAFNWAPRGKDTAFSLWLGDSYRDDSLLGMCGTCDGRSQNDAVRCDGQPLSNAVNTVAALQEMSESCVSGRNSADRVRFSAFNCTL